MQRLAIALMALTLAWACKDDSESSRSGDSGANSGGGDGGPRTALPGDKALGELSESETVALCEELRSKTNSEDVQQGTCVIAASVAVDFATSGGGTADEVQQACQEQLDACLTETPMPCQPIEFTADCKATVADFTDCSAIASQQLSALAGRSCDDIIGDSDAGTGAGDGGVTSGLEGELARCSAMLNACSSSS